MSFQILESVSVRLENRIILSSFGGDEDVKDIKVGSLQGIEHAVFLNAGQSENGEGSVDFTIMSRTPLARELLLRTRTRSSWEGLVDGESIPQKAL